MLLLLLLLSDARRNAFRLYGAVAPEVNLQISVLPVRINNKVRGMESVSFMGGRNRKYFMSS